MARQEAGRQPPWCRVNARQYRGMPRRWRWSSLQPIGARANWQSWLSASQVKGQAGAGVDPRRRWPPSGFPNVQLTERHGWALGWAGPIPSARPGPGFAGQGIALHQATWCTALRDRLRLPSARLFLDRVPYRLLPGRCGVIAAPFPGQYRPVPAWATGAEQITKQAGRCSAAAMRWAPMMPTGAGTRLINVKSPQLAGPASTFAVMSPSNRLAQGDHLLCGERHGAQCPPLPRMSWVFVSSLAAPTPQDVQLSLLDQKGNRLQVQTTRPQRSSPLRSGAGGLACCWPSRASIWQCCASMARPSSLHLRSRHPAPGGPNQLYLFSGRDLYRPGERLDRRSCSRGRMASCCRAWRWSWVKQPDGQLLEQKRLLPGQFGRGPYGLHLPEEGAARALDHQPQDCRR